MNSTPFCRPLPSSSSILTFQSFSFQSFSFLMTCASSLMRALDASILSVRFLFATACCTLACAEQARCQTPPLWRSIRSLFQKILGAYFAPSYGGRPAEASVVTTAPLGCAWPCGAQPERNDNCHKLCSASRYWPRKCQPSFHAFCALGSSTVLHWQPQAVRPPQRFHPRGFLGAGPSQGERRWSCRCARGHGGRDVASCGRRSVSALLDAAAPSLAAAYVVILELPLQNEIAALEFRCAASLRTSGALASLCVFRPRRQLLPRAPPGLHFPRSPRASFSAFPSGTRWCRLNVRVAPASSASAGLGLSFVLCRACVLPPRAGALAACGPGGLGGPGSSDGLGGLPLNGSGPVCDECLLRLDCGCVSTTALQQPRRGRRCAAPVPRDGAQEGVAV